MKKRIMQWLLIVTIVIGVVAIGNNTTTVSAKTTTKTVYAKQGKSVKLTAVFYTKKGKKIKIKKTQDIVWSQISKDSAQGGIASGKKFKIKKVKANDFYNGKNKTVYFAQLFDKKGKLLATTNYHICKK